MSKHAKGPWFRDMIGCIRDADGQPIMTAGDGCEGPEGDEGRANGHLMAAAPELLEACKKGLECAEALNTLGSFVGSSQQQKTVDAIKAAISKAEG